MELLYKVEQLREIVHHYKDKTEVWFGKYMKYKRHKKNEISYLLLRHFPLSSFTLPKTILSFFRIFRGMRW